MNLKLRMNLQLFALTSKKLAPDTGLGGDNTCTGSTGEENSTGDAGTGKGAGEGETKSFDDILKDKTYQSEFDKRVAKALETAKSKWDAESKAQVEAAKTEAQKLAKMNAEQKSKYEEDKRIAELDKREKDITTRELKAQAYETLAEKNLPKELIGTLNFSDAESCNASIEAVEKAFQSAVEKAVNDKLRGGNPPKSGQSNPNTGFNFNFTGVRPKK